MSMQDFDCSKAWNLWYATEKYILPELSESCKVSQQSISFFNAANFCLD
jgi:hypothetical protein